METAGVQFAQEFASRAEAMMNAFGDPAAEAVVQEAWNKFAKEREKEIIEVITRILIRESIVGPLGDWLAEQTGNAAFKSRAPAKPPTAADLFPSLKSQSN